MDEPTTVSRGQAAALRALERHPQWPHRACAPHPDNPARAAGDPTVPITAWVTPDREGQKARAAREEQALPVCAACPLRPQCLTYALGDDSGPNEPYDIWGGMTAFQRREHLKARARTTHAPSTAPADAGRAPAAPVPVGAGLTALDRRVLAALAAHRSPQAVAAAAQLPVSRANWHRSKLATALRLDPNTTTRQQLLHTARRAGLLPPTAVIVADRGLTAAVPSRQAAVARSRGIQVPLPGLPLALTTPRPATRTPATAYARLPRTALLLLTPTPTQPATNVPATAGPGTAAHAHGLVAAA